MGRQFIYNTNYKKRLNKQVEYKTITSYRVAVQTILSE